MMLNECSTLGAAETARVQGPPVDEVGATYAIGDVQGCFDDLLRLLDRIDFDPARCSVFICGPEGMMRFSILRWGRPSRTP